MENASKALIIAGAILLSILIIALGMRIYNSSTSSAANADLSATEIASFNSTFEAYEGKQKGTAVRQLIAAVRSSNNKNTDRYIYINGGRSGSDYIDFQMTEYDSKKYIRSIDEVEDNKTYDVVMGYDRRPENGETPRIDK